MSIENDSFQSIFCESEMLQHVQDMFKTDRTIMQVAEKWIADWRYKL